MDAITPCGKTTANFDDSDTANVDDNDTITSIENGNSALDAEAEKALHHLTVDIDKPDANDEFEYDESVYKRDFQTNDVIIQVKIRSQTEQDEVLGTNRNKEGSDDINPENSERNNCETPRESTEIFLQEHNERQRENVGNEKQCEGLKKLEELHNDIERETSSIIKSEKEDLPKEVENPVRYNHQEDLGFAEIQLVVKGESDRHLETERLPSLSAETKCQTTYITFQEAIEELRKVDLEKYTNQIRPQNRLTGFASLWNSVFGPPKLHKDLLQERNFIFSVALHQLDNTNRVHVGILQTLYKMLTGRKIDCERFGAHWEEIGFQGNDPATDLRGCGMLGLLTSLAFVTSTTKSKHARKIYALSRDEIQNFPFCVMSINVTRISLQILRLQSLNKECNIRYKNRSNQHQGLTVYNVFQDLYESIFYRIYEVWKRNCKTMADSGFVLNEVENYAKLKPLDVMRQYEKMQSTNENETSSSEGKIENFTGVEDLKE